MSFVFKNGCIYECWMSNRIWWFLKIKNLTAIFKVARYFSTRCVRRLEEHTKNTGNKVERSLVPFHIRSQMTQMHWCYSKCVCVSLGRHPHLIIFRILDSVSSLAIILLGMGSRLYYSFGFLFVNPVLYTSVEEHNSKLCPWFCTVHPCCIFPLININTHLLRTFVYSETAFTRSQANVEQRNLDRLCSKVEGNFSLQLLHNWFSKMIQRLKIEWKVISNRSADQHLFVKSYL